MTPVPLFFIVGLMLYAYLQGRIRGMRYAREHYQELKGEVIGLKVRNTFLQRDLEKLQRGHAVPHEITDRSLTLVQGGKE